MRSKIKQLYLEGYSAKEIAYKVCKTEVSVRKFISRNLKEFSKLHKEQLEIRQNKKKVASTEKIKQLYLKGYNAKEIADILNLSHGHIRNFISVNLRERSQEHRKSRDLNKSIIKSINNMNNSYISNAAFLKQNRQSYKYNKNNNLVFDEDTRGTRPTDVPKTFYEDIV